ncbi:MAG TPA: hypothetical protein VH988_08345 [Thermoanaerobaculia bacterium]|nr:hypothetical protein [Thermoanaerobaculia bacterium]
MTVWPAGRAREQLPLLVAGFPGDMEGEEADLYFARHGGVPCPVLDPATG